MTFSFDLWIRGYHCLLDGSLLSFRIQMIGFHAVIEVVLLDLTSTFKARFPYTINRSCLGHTLA